MTDTLFDIYSPLILWTGLGLLLFRFMPQAIAKFLGRALYWVGVPIEILALGRHTSFSQNWGMAPLVTFLTLMLGLAIAIFAWQGLYWLVSHKYSPAPLVSFLPSPSWFTRSRQGGFILATMLGNTGFVGLAIAPSLIAPDSLNWAVSFSVAHNLFGPYGFGLLVASYFGRSSQTSNWWSQVRNLLIVPSLWTFILGYLTQPIEFPPLVESGLQASVGIVSYGAFLLIGMRLSQISSWKSFRTALIPSGLRVVAVPLSIGLLTTLLGFAGDARLALVLMSGMPTAFMGLILAEEYDLDRELIASSIFVSTVMLMLVIPLWVFVFG
jgi:malate permease and related proteins